MAISGGDDGGKMGVIGEIGVPEASGVFGGNAATTVSSLAIVTLIFRGDGMRMPRNILEGGMVSVF